MPKISVLVAVYNAEKWLPKCLDSLLSQTYADIQIICIDDGSTDGSLALLQDYAARDARIEVIALPENGGQAHARNEGLKRAQGDYVCMLDADDWFSPDAFEKAMAAFDRDTDCVLFDVVMWYDEQREELYQMPAFDALTGMDAFMLSLDWQIHGLYMVRAAISSILMMRRVVYLVMTIRRAFIISAPDRYVVAAGAITIVNIRAQPLMATACGVLTI